MPNACTLRAAVIAALALSSAAAAVERKSALEEVIVTAQKREQSLQDAPIAISVLSEKQLEAQGISSLDALGNGAVPALRMLPYANTPSTQVMAIRGNGPVDIGTVTREASVAVYVDGIYLGRPQGLSMEIADLQRIEVLRGPQGTLFGRNATSGAVSLVSKKPSGKFGFEQTFSTGNYDAWRSLTRIDLPAIGGFSAKFDYLHSERDGWVKNTTPNADDFNAYEKDGGRLALNYHIGHFTADYVYDRSRQETTQTYWQVYEDFVGVIGNERDRETRTRYPLIPLDPTITKPQGHSLTLAWDTSEHLTFKSLSSYRKLRDDVSDNYGGSLYFFGLIVEEDAKQDQYSQEFQLIGNSERLEWVGGLYFFKEHVEQETTFLSSLNQAVVPFQPIAPPAPSGPPSLVKADSESQAVYGQITWTLPAWRDNLHLTVGGRYTSDEKSGYRAGGGGPRQDFDLDTSHFDPSITFDIAWSETLSTYAKWSSGYRAGGVNPRSASFTPYEEEKVKTIELGLKSEFLDRRVRLNADVFSTEYEDMQLTFSDPTNILVTETINAQRDIDVDGIEVDLTVAPVDGLLIGLSYVYLDGDMPEQPNPLGGTVTDFELTQTPQHAGALTVDYTFAPQSFGVLAAHFDATAADQSTYVQAGGRFDGYTLFNARLTLSEIPLGANAGQLKVSLWGKNLTDEVYIIMAFPSLPASIVQAFGDPRTYGADITYKF